MAHIPFILLIVAAITKRAQIPFSAWLPAAIAAPTPVSSLVHSSTLVTAGVYLIFRFSPLLGLMGGSKILLNLGLLTILIAGLSALYEIDIKKIIALSTLSQLGLIISTIGASLRVLAFFHLLAHAYFKALLFIVVGNSIHLSQDFQDLRKIAVRPERVPATLRFSLVANIRLCGIPFMAGFYSKDLIIELLAIGVSGAGILGGFLTAVGLTAAYTVRFLMVVSFNSEKIQPLI